MKRKTDILHILPHAGGGVGKVLRAVLAADSSSQCRYAHIVASLDSLNNVTRKHCDGLGIAWIDEVSARRREDLAALMVRADIVLIHWWNHPLLMRFLSDGLPKTRLIMWSHVNGFFPPQAFFPELFEMPDRFVFSTKISFMAPTVQSISNKLKNGLRVIRSCSGIPDGSDSLCRKTDPFQAGYIGTVEPVKMHNDFLDICARAGIPSPIVIAGGPKHEALRRRTKAMNLADGFKILGPVDDPKPIFKQLHAFAYALNPRHYGTGEQALIEAMAFGAVPVVLANPPEETLVCHGRTGIVADNAADFSEALRRLMENPAERDTLAAAGHRFVMEECGIEHTTKAFHSLFDEALSLSKRSRILRLTPIDGLKYGSPFHLFLASLGDTEEKICFEKALYKQNDGKFSDDFVSRSRGTPFHYRDMLGNDPELMAVCNAIMAGRN